MAETSASTRKDWERRFAWALAASLAVHAPFACPRGPWGDPHGTGAAPTREKPGHESVEIGIVTSHGQLAAKAAPPPQPVVAPAPEPKKPEPKKPEPRPPARSGLATRTQPKPAPVPPQPPRGAAQAVAMAPSPGEELRLHKGDAQAGDEARGGTSSIRAQRGRLPPPVECGDPVQGVWVSNQYMPWLGGWYLFTLSIHRAGDDLSGEIESHYWTGDESDSSPPACTPEVNHGVVKMTARGLISQGELVFTGMAIRSYHMRCGEPGWYFLDSFSGKIDAEAQEFQSVNNDGGDAIDIPTLFRRVRCLPEGHPT